MLQRSVALQIVVMNPVPQNITVKTKSCLRADVSYFLCCNKGNRRRLHAGKTKRQKAKSLKTSKEEKGVKPA